MLPGNCHAYVDGKPCPEPVAYVHIFPRDMLERLRQEGLTPVPYGLDCEHHHQMWAGLGVCAGLRCVRQP